MMPQQTRVWLDWVICLSRDELTCFSLAWISGMVNPLYVVNERLNGSRTWGTFSEQQFQFSVQGEPPSLPSLLSSLSPCVPVQCTRL